VIVVIGHESERLRAAISGLPVTVAHNLQYADGLSTSLRCGITAVPAAADGALICLGDMPQVTAAALKRLMDAFDPAAGRSIVVPVRHGQRGNPVLWARRYFPEIAELSGDRGARKLLDRYAVEIAEVAMESDAVLRDVDTPQDLGGLITRKF
jgi:molybdenum cofactor cytidylyltransferase